MGGEQRTISSKEEVSINSEVTLTKVASDHVKKYQAGQGKEDVPTCLRLAVKGGGCSGFVHQLALDVQSENDLVFNSNDCKVIIDPASFEFVKGSQIDYVEGLNASGFQVNNPNAASSCGCGNSFVMKEEDKCASAAGA